MLVPTWRPYQKATKLKTQNKKVKLILQYRYEIWRDTKFSIDKLQAFLNRCLWNILWDCETDSQTKLLRQQVNRQFTRTQAQ